MTSQRGGLVGRRTELAALVDERRRAGLTLVYGLPGSGKTALLKAARRAVTEQGAPVLHVSFSAEGPGWDLFGFRTVLKAVREQYEDFDTDSRLPESLESVSGLCTEEGYADTWTRFSLLHAMSTLFTRLSKTAPVTIILDGVDSLSDPILVVTPMRRAGHAVIASCRPPDTGFPDPFYGIAARTIELGPLSPDKISVLMRRVMNAPLAPAAEHAVRKTLGLLWGNPGAVLSTVANLREHGRLEVVNGLVCLHDQEKPIAVPGEHPFFDVLEPFGNIGKQLVLFAASSVGLFVEEVGFLEGGRGAGPVVDALIQAGLLECESSGRIRCRVPGIGVGVAQGETREARQRLHRGVAERLLENGPVAGRHQEIFVRQVAAAGRAMPRRAEFVGALRAAECSLVADSPARTDHLYAAWWHAGAGADRAGRQAELIRHLVRIADYAFLDTFVEEAVSGEPTAGERDELAVAAFLAAVHLGRPVSGDLREGLVRDGTLPLAVELADRWFAGEQVLPDEVVNCLFPVWRQVSFAAPQPGRPAWRDARLVTRLADACAVRDLVPVFEVLLGRDYRSPMSGPLATYHRARTGHAEGCWGEALDAVHELELQESADDLVREHVRLLGAEMYGWRGEGRRATAWLARVPQNGHFPLLRAWVEAGLCHHAGDIQEAFEVGWHACRTYSFPCDEVGASRLLLRLAWLANRIEDAGQRREVIKVAEAWHERQNSRRSVELLTLARSLVGGDDTGIRTTERFVRRQGDEHGLVLLSEAAARSSESPRRWLREAYEITRDDVDVPTGGHGATVEVNPSVHDQLSETELVILELVRADRTNRQIARAVRISEKTVEKHLTRLFAKAGCRTRYGLAMSGLGRQHDAIGA